MTAATSPVEQPTDGARELTYAEAVRETLTDLMDADERVFLMGEDIGVYGLSLIHI